MKEYLIMSGDSLVARENLALSERLMRLVSPGTGRAGIAHRTVCRDCPLLEALKFSSAIQTQKGTAQKQALASGGQNH